MEKIIFSRFLLTSIVCVLLYSCKSNGKLDIGDKGNISLELTDSIQVQTSTVLFDSLPSNNTGVMLSGKISDPDVGQVVAEPYLQLKVLSDLKRVPSNAVFDSLSLVLRYNGYSYGDTIPQFRFSVYGLKQSIKLRKLREGNEAEDLPVFVNKAALYTSSSFEYDPVVMGSIVLRARPNSKDSVGVRLDPKLGKTFLNLILNKDRNMTDPESFLNYFKGLVIRTENAKSILGFNTDSLKMYLYYHTVISDGTSKKERVVFGLNDKTLQFNHIESDRSATLLKTLNYTNKELKSENTEGRTFLQGATGIVTKINLPGLEKFLSEKLSVNKAELIIETNPETYLTYKAPPSLMLFIANKANVPKAILTDPFNTSRQIAVFRPGSETGSNGRYTFILTEYVNNTRKGTYRDGSLLLSVPLNELFSTVHRLNIKDKKQISSIKLLLYYTKF
jgi:hypothetical protein